MFLVFQSHIIPNNNNNNNLILWSVINILNLAEECSRNLNNPFSRKMLKNKR